MVTWLVVWLNGVAGQIGDIALQPIAWLPGWLSAALIGVVTGVLMLVVFKYTSNQAAIRRTRSRMSAEMLALSLFRDNAGVAIRAQGRLISGAARMVCLSGVPMLVLAAPTLLALGQLALWYQARPLQPGENAVVTVYPRGGAVDVYSEIRLEESKSAKIAVGPVRVPSKRMICWSIVSGEPGRHDLRFTAGDESFEKELAVGSGYMPVSSRRPAWNWSDVMWHPREHPFAPDSPIQSIEIDYPKRDSWIAGSDSWLITWFIVSMAAAFAIKPLLNVSF